MNKREEGAGERNSFPTKTSPRRIEVADFQETSNERSSRESPYPADLSRPSSEETDAKPIVPSWLVESIAETSKNASQIYVLYVSFLAYCTLTIFTTSDEQIFFNQSTLLPIVNLGVSSIVFFVIAPIIAIGLFVYLQFYQCRLTGMLNKIRANYAPLGKERLYPWLISFAEEPEEGFVGTLQKVIAQISLWWLLPLILALFSLWNLKRHSTPLSLLVALLHILSAWIVVFFWSRYQPSLYLGRRILLVVVLSFQICLVGFLVFLVKPGYIGARYINESQQGWLQAAFSNLTNVDFSHRDFTSSLPQNANSDSPKRLLERELAGAYLEGVRLDGSNLKEVSLYHANLQGASLTFAKLQKSDLTGAQLQAANLGESDLTEAALSTADLTGALLLSTVLDKARLVSTVFRDARLVGAKLQGTVLIAADFEGADLRRVRDLTTEQLASVCTLYRAKLDNELIDSIRSQYPYLLEEPKRDDKGMCLKKRVD